MLKVIIIMLISYLFGSISWALVIGKVFYHKDIRHYGSGNLGATNAGRVLGKPAGVIVTLLDVSKAVMAMCVAWFIYKPAIPFAGLACCLGHCFPVFANFKGGKAVATTFGYFLGLAIFVNHSWFWQFFFPVIVFFAVLYACRMVSVSSMTSVGAEVLASVILPSACFASGSSSCIATEKTFRGSRPEQSRRSNGWDKTKKGILKQTGFPFLCF